jgi:hypothetical protein
MISNLAITQFLPGKLHKARPNAVQALRITEASFGRDHPKVAMDLLVLATIQRALGNENEAVRTLRRRAQIADFNQDSEDPQLQDLRDFLLDLSDED